MRNRRPRRPQPNERQGYGRPIVSESTCGFTLIEVLIALTIAVVLIGVTAATLGTTLQAERSLNRLEEGRRISEEALAELYLHGTVTNVAARHAPAWVVSMHEAETGPANDRVRWIVWEIVPVERPSAAWRLARRE